MFGGGARFLNNALKKNKKLLALTVILIVAVFIVLLGSSYAYLYTTIVGEKTYGLTVKGFSLLLDETSTSESINLENSEPMSDEDGKQTLAYTFSITNEDTSETGYILYLDDVVIEDEVNRLEDTKVKYQLIENNTEKVGLVSELGVNPLRILSDGILEAGATNNYSLRFWIDEDAEVFSNQKFSVSLRIIATSTEVIESGKLNPGETIVTTPSGTTEMTNEQLQTYIEKYVENAISNVNVSCEDCQNIISDAFDDKVAYTKGDYVIYNNTLYQFTSDKEAGVWDEGVVEATTVMDEVGNGSISSEPELLWTNSDYVIGEQTATISNLSEYKEFVVIVKWSKTSSTLYSYAFHINETMGSIVRSDFYTLANRSALTSDISMYTSAIIVNFEENTISFTKTTLFYVVSDKAMNSDSYFIPYQIYGLK